MFRFGDIMDWPRNRLSGDPSVQVLQGIFSFMLRANPALVLFIAILLTPSSSSANPTFFDNPNAAIARIAAVDPIDMVPFLANQVTTNDIAVRWKDNISIAIFRGTSFVDPVAKEEIPLDIASILDRLKQLTGIPILVNGYAKSNFKMTFSDERDRYMNIPARVSHGAFDFVEPHSYLYTIGAFEDPATGRRYLDRSCTGNIGVNAGAINFASVFIDYSLDGDSADREACLMMIMTEAFGVTRWYVDHDIGRFIPQSLRIRALYNDRITAGDSTKEVERVLREVFDNRPDELEVPD